jgi:ABC-type sugar transport system permease subunit
MKKHLFNKIILVGSLLFLLGTGYELFILNQPLRIEQIILAFFVIPYFISAVFKIITKKRASNEL